MRMPRLTGVSTSRDCVTSLLIAKPRLGTNADTAERISVESMRRSIRALFIGRTDPNGNELFSS